MEHEHRLTAVEERAKSNSHRLDDVEKRQSNLETLTSSVKVLADREARVEEDVKEIKADVKTITDKPAKRWDKVIETIIVAIVSGLVGFLVAYFTKG